MNIIYWDIIGGVSGDMLTAALLDICPEKESFLLEELKKLPLKNWQWYNRETKKQAFRARTVGYNIQTHQPQRNLSDIEKIIAAANYPPKVSAKIRETFKLLAQAESKAHGIKEEEVHFHEVGADDTILDITAVCLLMADLKIEKIYCSDLPVGNGLSQGCHGLMPHPAPALNMLLENTSLYGITEDKETITPTGLALLKAHNAIFAPAPPMQLKKIGVGAGDGERKRPNILRCFLGTSKEEENSIYRLETTVDDMSGEDLGALWHKVFQAGAIDMYITPVQMKKNRPGQKITILTKAENLKNLTQCVFQHTTTLGLICQKVERQIMQRKNIVIDTDLGKINCKIATGWNVEKIKPEYEDLAKISKETGLSLREIRQIVNESLAKKKE